MARINIVKKDGTVTPYFWSDKDGSKKTHHSVYKQTDDGVKRMKDIHFDAVANRVHRKS